LELRLVFVFQRLTVGIFISGFAFSENDYPKPWEGWKTNLETISLAVEW
jgi:hypothetical protein